MANVSIAIIGAGVAGMSAAIYARRANADVVIFEQLTYGGLTATIDKIDNYPSAPDIEGWKLAENMFSQVTTLGTTVRYEQVLSVTKDENGDFVIKTPKGAYNFASIVIATGTKHNKLGIEDKYVGKGVSYCATCDGGFFRGKAVAVAGGGSHAVKEALYLAGVCGKVYVLAPTAELSGDELTLQQLKSQENVEILYNKTVTELKGEPSLAAVAYSDIVDQSEDSLEVSALFVAVGSVPATDFLGGLDVARNKGGFIEANDRMMTSIDGLFTAGDVSNGVLKQIVTACSDGAKAGQFAVSYARARNK
jgi:thioredoxin reductase (NADPH)